MANKEALLQYVAQKLGPEELQRMVDQIEQELSQDPDVTPEVIDELINQLNFVTENPERYKEVITYAIQAGAIDPNDVPQEFDPIFIGLMLLALTELKHSRMAPQAFAKGGLAAIAAKGRGGDTMLAHINPREAEVLRRMGGTGTINPHTGLREFKGGIFKSISKVVSSVSKAVLPAVATAFGGPIAGALTGAAMGALSGGGLKGALLGGLGSSLMPGGLLGNVAQGVGSSILGTGIGSALSSVVSPATLGAGVLGAGVGALTGGVKGAIKGGIGAGLGASAAGGINNAINVYQGGGGLSEIGKALFSGNPLKGSTPTGVIDNAAIGTEYNPEYYNASGQLTMPGTIESANMVQDPISGVYYPADSVAGKAAMASAQMAESGGAAAAAEGASSSWLPSSDTVLKGLFGLNAVAGKPQVPVTAAPAMTEEQKQAMGRGLTNYTADWNEATLPLPGTPEYDEMMRKISMGVGINFMNPSIKEVPKARGGALSMLAQGGGDGRADTIHAKLSDGEYVIDAETVALLGNGSTKAGAAALDMMRKQIRQQKGKVLAKGKFSPDAKSPLAYMKGRKK